MGNSYIGALLAIVMFGTYMVPLKMWPKYSSWAYLSMLSIGALLSAIGVAFATGTFNLNPVGVLCGVLWVAGGAFSFWAIQAEADLAGASVRAMGVSILASFLSGVFLFGEYSDYRFSVPAIILFLVGLSRLTPSAGGSILKNWRSFLGGFVFGTYLIPFKMATAHGLQLSDLEFVFPFTVGIFLGSQILVGILTFKRKKSFGYPVLPSVVSMGTGVLWMIGTHGCFWAIASFEAGGTLGYAVGYPLTQLNLLVNLSWGVFVFGEYKTAKERIKLLLATFIILAGAVLLTLSKG